MICDSKHYGKSSSVGAVPSVHFGPKKIILFWPISFDSSSKTANAHGPLEDIFCDWWSQVQVVRWGLPKNDPVSPKSKSPSPSLSAIGFYLFVNLFLLRSDSWSSCESSALRRSCVQHQGSRRLQEISVFTLRGEISTVRKCPCSVSLCFHGVWL